SRFNHSKCYILDDSVFIGSSNFTSGGLIGNYELNAGLYQPGVSKTTREWFDRMWDVSEPTKEKLIELLESSKFGIPADPHDVYIKMIFERYRDQLAPDKDEQHYPVELASFQKEAVRTALFIISEFYGAMIADATGLGKTNMGMEILRQKILKENRKVLLIAPSQVLRSMWDKKLREAGLSVRKQVTMESLGRNDSIKWHEYKNIDFVLIDESQNFRSKNANRSTNLARIMTIGKRKQALLLSATPINNSIMDLYYQISIFTQRDDTYFWRSIGIPDLYNHMREAANKEGGLEAGLEKIQRLLDGVMVRRTRSYIQEVYKNDKINGQEIKFPKHTYSPIHYSLADLYGNVYERILADMHKLTMAPYGLEQYNTKAEDKEKARHLVLAHLQVILLLKRFESSIEAVKVSLDNKIRLYEHIVEAANSGKMAKVKDFNKIISRGNYIINRTDSAEDSDNDFDMDKFIITEMEKLDKERIDKKYDIEKFKTDLSNDLKILVKLRSEMDVVTADKKLEAVRDVILKDKAIDSGKKVLIFTEYTTTARYLLKKLKVQFPKNVIECITGITKPSTRSRYLERFAPKSNLADDQILEEKEIDILISTEVLAEGQNLQDCNYVINYDLPWNPMRIVQRIGRVDRLTSKHDTIHSRACYPDRELDGILELMGKLLKKIQTVDKVIGLDSDLLGEIPTPKQYNGHIRDRLKILGDEGQAASDVIFTMGRNADLMPQNTPLSEITRWAKDTGIDELRAMTMGRRSGKVGSKKKCILAYSREKPERYVYFVVYDYEKDKACVPDNEYDAVNEARCIKDEPMYLPMDEDGGAESFKELLRIDEKARQAIKESDDQIRKYATNTKNTRFENTQKNIKSILSNELKSGNLDSERLTHVSKILNRTELQAWESHLSGIISRYGDDKNVELLLKGVNDLGEQLGVKEETVISNDKIDYESMNLIGAIFITPKDDNKKTSNNGLIKAVPAQTKLT
ncbi:MAG: helicase-related protein, partial [Thaumarchaeota archaeon]|nr:helicase-related protein [Nitrososphaerota archaeon]